MSFIIKKFSIKQLAKLVLLPLFSPILSYAEIPDFANNVLTLPSVTVGDTTFNNVKLNLNLAAGTVSLENYEPEHIFEISTLLSPSSTVPKTISVGAAGSLMKIDTTTGAISGFIVTSGISDLTAAHIHEGAAGVNGSPIITLQLDAENNLFTIPSGSVLTEEQITQLQEGNLYLNVHTSTNANGELREQLDINSRKIQNDLLKLLSGS